MEHIIEYIKREYDPISIILYGSYANGTNDMNSDFDALVISSDHERYHDTSFVDGVQLDVFVYPKIYFDGDYNLEDFIRIFDGKIILDKGDIAQNLQDCVLEYLQNRPHKAEAEIKADIDWCIKMCERVKRCDAEGLFRWHWVLVDSLEIFCDIHHRHYFGPKKSLQWMQKKHPTAFELYTKALTELNMTNLLNWISYVKDINGTV